MQQGAREVEPHLHALRELVDALVGGIRKIDVGEDLDAVAHRPVVEGGKEPKVFERGQAQIDGGKFEADADPLVEVAARARDRRAEEQDLSRISPAADP